MSPRGLLTVCWVPFFAKNGLEKSQQRRQHPPCQIISRDLDSWRSPEFVSLTPRQLYVGERKRCVKQSSLCKRRHRSRIMAWWLRGWRLMGGRQRSAEHGFPIRADIRCPDCCC